jgi:DNA-binding transcriptional ArsR family regulator
MAEPEDAERISALRAVAHPVRLQILSLLTGTAMSAAEVARELGLTHANASYHLRVLADAGTLEEAGEERIRGGIAKRYRHPWQQPERPTSKPSAGDLVLHLRAMAEELVRRGAMRRPATKTFTSDAEMWVAPEVWEEVEDLVRRAASLVHDRAQPPRTPGTIHVNLTAAAFQMQEPTEGDAQ